MKVTKVFANDDFSLTLYYDSGEVRIFDAKPLLNLKPWNALRDIDLFKQAKPFFNTVAWPNAIDIAPETLYLDAKPMAMVKQS